MIKRECRVVTRMFWDYALRRLSESETDRVEIHIARCDKCRKELQTYRITAGLLNRGRKEPEPESQATWHALRTQLQHVQKEKPLEIPQPARKASAVPLWAGTIAAGAVLAAVWTSFRASDVKPESIDLMALKRGVNTPLAATEPLIQVGATQEPQRPVSEEPETSSGPTIQDASFQRGESPSAADSATLLSDTFRLRPEEQFQLKSANARRSQAKRAQVKSATDSGVGADSPENLLSEPRREFVMGTIPMNSRIVPVSNGAPDSAGDPPVW